MGEERDAHGRFLPGHGRASGSVVDVKRYEGPGLAPETATTLRQMVQLEASALADMRKMYREVRKKVEREKTWEDAPVALRAAAIAVMKATNSLYYRRERLLKGVRDGRTGDAGGAYSGVPDAAPADVGRAFDRVDADGLEAAAGIGEADEEGD